MRLPILTTFGVLAIAIPSAQQPQQPRIMTFAEYARIDHPVPYILKFTAGPGALVYFGAKHIRGVPSDPQVQQIADLWLTFKPTLALNEGWDPPVAPTIQSAAQITVNRDAFAF